MRVDDARILVQAACDVPCRDPVSPEDEDGALRVVPAPADAVDGLRGVAGERAHLGDAPLELVDRDSYGLAVAPPRTCSEREGRNVAVCAVPDVDQHAKAPAADRLPELPRRDAICVAEEGERAALRGELPAAAAALTLSLGREAQNAG